MSLAKACLETGRHSVSIEFDKTIVADAVKMLGAIQVK
jgi:hypothetical protein